MRLFAFKYISLSILLLLTACQSSFLRPNVVLSRVIIRNATSGDLHDILILHKPTNRTGSTNYILAGYSLDIGFPPHSMLADSSVLTWKDERGRSFKQELVLPYDLETARRGEPRELVYIIHPNNIVMVHFEKPQLK